MKGGEHRCSPPLAEAYRPWSRHLAVTSSREALTA